MTNKHVYRPTSSWVYFGFIAAVELSVIIAFAVAGKTQDVILSLINSIAADALCYILLVRPKLVYSDEGILIVNPLRSFDIGWEVANEFDTRFSFKVETDEGTFGAWAATAPGRMSTRHMHESDYRGTGLGSRKVISPSDNPRAESGVALILALKRKSEAVAAGTAGNYLTKSFNWVGLALCILCTATLIYNFLH